MKLSTNYSIIIHDYNVAFKKLTPLKCKPIALIKKTNKQTHITEKSKIEIQEKKQQLVTR